MMSTSIRAFHAFHNLFVIEKGDNTEPTLAPQRVSRRLIMQASTVGGEARRTFCISSTKARADCQSDTSARCQETQH
jgi:hypothetical protein